jgi:catechol-2,3-dioxygenase
MSVPAPAPDRATAPSAIDPELRIGGVELGVSDLPRSADFYERVLGLERHSTAEGI